MKNVGFNRTNVVNKYFCNYNDLCLEFVKICLLNVTGFRVQWLMVITQKSAVLIYFMAEAWNHDYRDSLYIPVWSESNSALLQTSVCTTIESVDVMNCFSYVLDPLEPQYCTGGVVVCEQCHLLKISAMFWRPVFSKTTLIHMIITGSFTAFIPLYDFKCCRFVLWCMWNFKMIFMCPVIYIGVVEWTLLLSRFSWVIMICHWVSNRLCIRTKMCLILQGR
jgi:hypothetical protein